MGRGDDGNGPSCDIDPEFHIKVNLSSLTSEKDILPLWSLDDGIIEGALTARYLTEGNVLIRREEVEGDPDEFCRYNLIFRESKEYL